MKFKVGQIWAKTNSESGKVDGLKVFRIHYDGIGYQMADLEFIKFPGNWIRYVMVDGKHYQPLLWELIEDVP